MPDASLVASLQQGACSYGQSLLLLDKVLLVGVPGAEGGAGLVAVLDVTTPASPVELCRWRAAAAAA